MSQVVLDDHLLRDVLTDTAPSALRQLLRTRQAATTNLFYLRLCRSVATAAGGQLTGSLPVEARQQLGRALVALPDGIEIVPMRHLAYSMAVLVQRHGLSSLGAEAVAAAGFLGAPLCVSSNDDGPRIRAAASAAGVAYRVVEPA